MLAVVVIMIAAFLLLAIFGPDGEIKGVEKGVLTLPMFFGLISRCYSSVCIASILWAMWEKRKEKKPPVAAELRGPDGI